MARSKASYDKDIAKSCADGAAWSKAKYDKDIEASCTHKRQPSNTTCMFTF